MASEDDQGTWDGKEVERAVCSHFKEKAAGEVEGPARLGKDRAWRVWTYAEGEYHAHYAVARGRGPLTFYRDFQPFGDWLHDAFTAAAEHGRRMEVVRVAVASIIILTMLGLAVWQVKESGGNGFNLSHVISVLLGAGVAYLLGYRVQEKQANT